MIIEKQVPVTHPMKVILDGREVYAMEEFYQGPTLIECNKALIAAVDKIEQHLPDGITIVLYRLKPTEVRKQTNILGVHTSDNYYYQIAAILRVDRPIEFPWEKE